MTRYLFVTCPACTAVSMHVRRIARRIHAKTFTNQTSFACLKRCCRNAANCHHHRGIFLTDDPGTMVHDPRQAIPTTEQSQLEISSNANLFGQQCSFPLSTPRNIPLILRTIQSEYWGSEIEIVADPTVPPDLASILATLAHLQ